jgi:cytochrome c-type biogenesis protein CcmH
MRRFRGPARRRAMGLAALATALAAFFAAPAAAPATDTKATLPEIESEVMCPICGTLLELSDSPQAQREKAYIRRLLNEGKTKQQVEDALVAQYGTAVLANPPASGFDLSAYLVPALAILGAAIAIALGVWRWRGQGRSGPPGGSAEPPLGESEEKKLDTDLARYEL